MPPPRDDGGFDAFDHADRVKEGSAFEYAERVREGGGLSDDEDSDRRPDRRPSPRHPWPHHHWDSAAP